MTRKRKRPLTDAEIRRRLEEARRRQWVRSAKDEVRQVEEHRPITARRKG